MKQRKMFYKMLLFILCIGVFGCFGGSDDDQEKVNVEKFKLSGAEQVSTDTFNVSMAKPEGFDLYEDEDCIELCDERENLEIVIDIAESKYSNFDEAIQAIPEEDKGGLTFENGKLVKDGEEYELLFVTSDYSDVEDPSYSKSAVLIMNGYVFSLWVGTIKEPILESYKSSVDEIFEEKLPEFYGWIESLEFQE